MKRKLFFLTVCMIFNLVQIQAQITNSLNKLLPVDLVDSRKGIFRSVTGMDFMVRIFLIEGIKNLDACSDADYGKFDIEIMWYDINTELGKSQIDMIKLIKADDQQKKDYLGIGPYKELVGGSLVLETKSAACINSITGATGKTEYTTKAKYFLYTGAAIVKISYNGKINPETAKNIIANAANQINGFNFAVFKNTTADEKE